MDRIGRIDARAADVLRARLPRETRHPMDSRQLLDLITNACMNYSYILAIIARQQKQDLGNDPKDDFDAR